MRRIFLFLFLLFVSVSSTYAVPRRFTTHLNKASVSDCDQMLAQIVQMESYDRDLKTQLDEVPQCVMFFKERLLTFSFRGPKDYYKACQYMLQSFCQENRYLSLPTIIEDYELNQTKKAGALGLAYMVGQQTGQTIRKIGDRLKKSKGRPVEANRSRLQEIFEGAQSCATKESEKCIISWKLADKKCEDLDSLRKYIDSELQKETRDSQIDPESEAAQIGKSPREKYQALLTEVEEKCECVPDKKIEEKTKTVENTEVKILGKDQWVWNEETESCINNGENECLANNGSGILKPTVYDKNGNPFQFIQTNAENHIVQWAWSPDRNKGYQGCYIQQCSESFVPAIGGRECVCPSGYKEDDDGILGTIGQCVLGEKLELIQQKRDQIENERIAAENSKPLPPVTPAPGGGNGNTQTPEQECKDKDPKELDEHATEPLWDATDEICKIKTCESGYQVSADKLSCEKPQTKAEKDAFQKLCDAGFNRVIHFGGVNVKENRVEQNCPHACLYFYTDQNDPDPEIIDLIRTSQWGSNMIEVFCQPDLNYATFIGEKAKWAAPLWIAAPHIVGGVTALTEWAKNDEFYFRIRDLPAVSSNQCDSFVEKDIHDIWVQYSGFKSDDSSVEDVTRLLNTKNNEESFAYAGSFLGGGKFTDNSSLSTAQSALSTVLKDLENLPLGEWQNVCQ